tara:strand:+ start:94 stop:1002 length:909 start_codon:yes stop_codon:yes gene_type:complete
MIMTFKSNIQFIKNSNKFLLLSITVFIVSVFLIFLKGIKKSIDFKGGTIINLTIESDKYDLSILRDVLSNKLTNSINVVEMKTELNDYEVVVTTEYLSNESQVSDVLKSLYNDSYKINKIESIGPKIGKELSKNARNAIIASLILIGLYISIRFDFSYAVGSIAALLHDLIITLGVFVVVDYEISVAIIAALLTIVGYSLNDTIVIYDRIRENLTNNPHRTKDQTINESLNQTLARTVVTSLTTLLVVMVLFLYGGNVLKPFAFTLIVGVLLGTYSSLFVASPIMLYLEEKFNLEVEEKENI